MKRLLLVAVDYPPPVTTAGIIPMRLARHLPGAGWEVEVVRRHASQDRFADTNSKTHQRSLSAPGQVGLFYEWLPFGDALFSVHKMLREGLERHHRRPFDAVLVSAAPVAGCLVGDAIGRRTGLPVVHLHGDPWGPCRQRGPLRPFWTRWIEWRAERLIVARSSAVVLNTETARDDYVAAFPQVAAERFHVLRSPVDCDELDSHQAKAFSFDRPTVLYPGSFGGFVSPRPLFALAEAMVEAAPDIPINIVLTDDPGPLPGSTASKHIRVIGRQLPEKLGQLFQAADVLLAISQPSNQRIPLKLSDYLCSARPVAVLETARNEELRQFVASARMGTVFDAAAPKLAARWILDQLRKGRHPEMPRDPDVVLRLSAAQAARRLADILAAAVECSRRSRP